MRRMPLYTATTRAAASVLMIAGLIAHPVTRAQTPLPKEQPSASPTAPTAPADSGMDASLLYNTLLAEVLAAQGQLLAAAQLMADIARHEGSRPELYERATQLALMAGQPQLGIKIVDSWRREKKPICASRALCLAVTALVTPARCGRHCHG